MPATQLGLFDAELAEVRQQLAEREETQRLNRAQRFEARKAAVMADTAAWKGGEHSQRIDVLLGKLLAVGDAGAPMHDAILIGINAAAKAGRLDDRHVTFVEEKARIEVARVADGLDVVKPVVWVNCTAADVAADDPGSGQLPVEIQQAAADRLNVFGPQLAALGFKNELEVSAASPKSAQAVKQQMNEVRHALMLLAPARFRIAKGYKLASQAKLDSREEFASTVLGIDTRAYPGVLTAVVLTASGLHQNSVAAAAKRDQNHQVDMDSIVTTGYWVGAVVDVQERRLAQKVGRDLDSLVWHAIDKFSGPVPNLGDIAEINYVNGVGITKNLQHERTDRGVGR